MWEQWITLNRCEKLCNCCPWTHLYSCPGEVRHDWDIVEWVNWPILWFSPPETPMCSNHHICSPPQSHIKKKIFMRKQEDTSHVIYIVMLPKWHLFLIRCGRVRQTWRMWHQWLSLIYWVTYMVTLLPSGWRRSGILTLFMFTCSCIIISLWVYLNRLWDLPSTVSQPKAVFCDVQWEE